MKEVKTLYLGLDPSRYSKDGLLLHYPIIQTVPYSVAHPKLAAALHRFDQFSHLILTSRAAVKYLTEALEEVGSSALQLLGKQIFAVGKGTALAIENAGGSVTAIAHPESSEGIVALLDQFDLSQSSLFYAHSDRARKVIRDALQARGLNYCVAPLYTTVVQKIEPLPDLEQFNEIVFTSPSCVEAFLEVFGDFPKDKKLVPIGTVTKAYLDSTRFNNFRLQKKR